VITLLGKSYFNRRRWLARTIRAKYRRSTNPKKHNEDVKARIGVQVDDLHFKSLLADADLKGVKEYAKWNWDGIVFLIQGPLRNARRLEEAMRTSKLLKQLLVFYRPSSRQFSDIKKSKGVYKYVRIGIELCKVLLVNVEGMRFLVESRLLQEIAECLGQLDPSSEQPDDVFSREKMTHTLTSENFALLGSLTKSVEGVKVLERCRVFTVVYGVGGLALRDDVVKALICCMDYNM
jgi:rapamycin-insensitive companion of mTOR